ncbi:MAG: thermonuclease family protein [Mariprofundales bacterium]|nr:thermonuclease family protein [Mariprofundales bacterium]
MMIRRLAVAACLVWLLMPLAADAGTLSFVSNDRWVTVGRIYDGDTFQTTDGERIRLLGLNTPEITHRDSAGQPYGIEATKRLTQLIAGKSLKLAFDKEKIDIYGRTLAQLYDRQGRWINGMMVREGWAHVYTFVPNLRWAHPLLVLEQQARRAKLGIWALPRWKVLKSTDLRLHNLGQFRVVQGVVTKVGRHGRDFYLGAVHVTVPRKYRRYFDFPLAVMRRDRVTVRGRVRTSGKGRWFIALHAPTDFEPATNR